MGIFDLFKQGKKGQQSGKNVDGMSRESAIKILPPSDPAAVRKMREAGREMFSSFAAMKGAGNVLDQMASQEMNAAMDAMVSEQFKMMRLEQMFGKEGTSWECGNRVYFDNDIQSQEILFKNGKKVTLYFDFSEFHSLTKRIP